MMKHRLYLYRRPPPSATAPQPPAAPAAPPPPVPTVAAIVAPRSTVAPSAMPDRTEPATLPTSQPEATLPGAASPDVVHVPATPVGPARTRVEPEVASAQPNSTSPSAPVAPQAPTPPPNPSGPPPAKDEGPPQEKARRFKVPKLADPPTPIARLQAIHIATLVLIAGAALVLRLRDPLSSPVIGAEDPYLHMERTWNLLQGQPTHYPIGFMILLAPFALLGPDNFYTVVRFMPPLIGVGSVVSMFFLCRRYMHPMGALAAGFILAVMPEHILRTELMFPTALDLALLPLLFLMVLQASEGSQRALHVALSLGAAMLLVHPWVLVIALPPLALFWVILLSRNAPTRKWAPATVAIAGVLLVAIVAFLPSTNASNGPLGMVTENAIPRFGQIASTPSSVFPLPDFVNLPWQITLPILGLAAVGAVLAFVRRTRLTLLAVLWTAFLLPLVLVDWFGLGFLPHRVVVYLGLGLAILAALPILELVRLFEASKSKAAAPAALGILAVLALLTLPAAAAVPPWYRVYDDQDFQAYHALNDRGTSYLVTGSWESRAGYRALTGNAANFNPLFFQDERVRSWELENHPGLVVVIDQYTESEEHLPTDFLQSWNQVGQWGDTVAYTKA